MKGEKVREGEREREREIEEVSGTASMNIKHHICVCRLISLLLYKDREREREKESGRESEDLSVYLTNREIERPFLEVGGGSEAWWVVAGCLVWRLVLGFVSVLWVWSGSMFHVLNLRFLKNESKSDFLKLSPPWVAREFLFACRNLVLAFTLLFLSQFGQTQVLRTPKIMLFLVISSFLPKSESKWGLSRANTTPGDKNFKKSDFMCLYVV
eukprot:sb/3470130/